MVIKKKVVKQQAKRILAFVFAFILTVGTMSTLPAGMFVKNVKAADPVKYSLDTTKAGNVLDSDAPTDWDTSSTGWSKYKGTKKTQENGVFSYFGKGTKVQIKDDGKYIVLGGSVSNSGQAGIEIAVPSDRNYTLNVEWSSKNASDAILKLGEKNEAGQYNISPVDEENQKTAADKKTYETVLEAGKVYLIGGTNGINIYSMSITQILGDKVSAAITYNDSIVSNISSIFSDGALGDFTSSKSEIIFTENPDASKLNIKVSSDNVYSGTSGFTAELDEAGKKILVKNGSATLIAIPYLIDGYLNTPSVGTTEKYEFVKAGADNKVFGKDTVESEKTTSPEGYILLSKNNNASLVTKNNHGLYATSGITFTVIIPAQSQGTFTINGCVYSHKTDINYYVNDDKVNDQPVELFGESNSTDVEKPISYKNTTSSDVTLRIDLVQDTAADYYIHAVQYTVSEIPNTVSGTMGTEAAGKTIKFKSGSVEKTTVVNSDGSYSVNLKNGLKYEISLTDSTQYTISEESASVDLTNAALGQAITHNIVLEEIPVVVKHPEKVKKIPSVTNFGNGQLIVSELGQTLVLAQKNGSLVTENIESSNLSFYAFENTSAANTLEADIVVTAEANGSTNRFVGLGVIKKLNTASNQYAAVTSAVRNNNDVVMLYSKKETEVLGKSGNTAVAAAKEEKLHIKVNKTDDGITLAVTNEDGKSNPKTMTYDSIKYGSWSKSDELQYGFIFSGVTATVTNMIYKDASGNVIYDQNAYYDPMGNAPVADSVTAVAASDRTKIDVSWTGTSAKYDGKYILEVLKPGESQWQVVSNNITDKSYEYKVRAGEGGNYRFRVSGTLGNNDTEKNKYANTSTKAVLSNIAYVEPALDTPDVSVSYMSKADKVTLTWGAVDQATQYEIYRRSSDETTSKLIETVSTTSYTDTTVSAETPYYYSVKALSSDNFSVISDEKWTLPTNGHTGDYDEDVPLYVTKRSYNTVSSDSITIEGVAGAPGTVSVYVNGTKQQSANIEAANDLFKFNDNIKLSAGRNEVKLVLEYGTGLKVEKTLNYVLLSNYDYVVDQNYDGDSGNVAPEYGVPTYKKVQDAIDAVPADNASTKVIFVRNGEYNEQVVVNSKNVSLIGEDSEKTHIYFASCEANKTTASTTSSRYAFAVNKGADNFTAENICMENSYEYTGKLGNESAEAFYSEAKNTMLVGVRLESYQDTLQFKNNGNAYFLRCFILGNVDYMWGQNTKAVFDDCELKFRYSETKNSGYYTAFNTSTIVYNNCRFTSEDSCGGSKYFLGRPYNNKDVEIVFVNCYMGGALNAETGSTDWSQNIISSNEEVYAVAKYLEYGTYGKAFKVNINRRQISKAGADSYLSKAGKAEADSNAAQLSASYTGDKTINLNKGFVSSEYNASKYSKYEGNDSGLAKYNAEGFAASAGVTGGGLLKETNSNYYKVKDADEFLDAITAIKNKKGVPSVIELTADINLGYNEITDVTKYPSNVLAKHNDALINPILMKSGVSKVYIQDISNLTIFSAKGYSIKHAAIDIKQSSNIMIRNIKFDELWEWDEHDSGDYDTNDWDYMTIENASTGIWIDHCTFYKSYDGVIDMKTDMQHDTEMDITVSWCEFLPGSEDNIFFNEMMDYLDKNVDDCPYYKSLLDAGMSKSQIWWYAYGQKKTHLLGQSDEASTNENLKVTFANNYYYNSMDRMPRVRFGTAHVYNCMISSQELANARASITNENAAKHIVSNGASSTCGAHVLMENSVIDGVTNALNSGNGSSPAGYINAINTDYFLKGIKAKLEVTNNNTQKDGALIQDADEFISGLPYSYVTYDSNALETLMVPYAGAEKMKFTTLQWEKSSYIDDKPIVTSSNVETIVGEGAPKTDIDLPFDELKKLIFTDEELEQIAQGIFAKVILTVDKKDSLDDKEESLISQKIAELNKEISSQYKIGLILDFNLFKVLGNNETQLSETRGLIPITVTLPETLIPSDSSVARKYKVLRIHDNKVEELPVKAFNFQNRTITFETDKFSTYVIVYEDEALNEVSKDPSSETGDLSNTGMMAAMMATSFAGMVGAAYVLNRKKKSAR